MISDEQRFLFEELYHVYNDPRLGETNERLHQINDSLQKDYQSTVSLAEHRHLLTVRTHYSLFFSHFYVVDFSSGPMVLVR